MRTVCVKRLKKRVCNSESIKLQVPDSILRFSLFLGVGVWKRDVSGGQSVEEALMKNTPKIIPLCYYAGNGESIALKYDGTGFVTVSEAEDEADAQSTNVPIFFYDMPDCLSD